MMVFILNSVIKHNGTIHPQLMEYDATPLAVSTDINKLRKKIDIFDGERVQFTFKFVLQLFNEDCILVEQFKTEKYCEIKEYVDKLIERYGENNES